MLWFAWKIVLLQYRKQLLILPQCEKKVVICLKNRTFAVSQTTWYSTLYKVSWLWFAWKIVLLQYRKQRRAKQDWTSIGCDLLEKSYFCSIANNVLSLISLPNSVVICLKNRTFAVSQTTWPREDYPKRRLWFAWKIVLLQYRKQLRVARHILRNGCDLLEKSYFCSIANNSSKSPVIGLLLWFAWKIVLLQYRKQP